MMTNAKEKTPKAAKPTALVKTKSMMTSADQKARLARASAWILKTYGHKPIAHETLGFVQTGYLAVDNLIGGTLGPDGLPICPGFPRRRITEVFGPEGSGKTTLALSAMAQVQKAGGVGLFLDFENKVDLQYARKLGVINDRESFQCFQPNSMEEGFEMIRVAIMVGVDIIVIDSIAAMNPEAELVKKFTDAAKVGAVAGKLTDALKKYCQWLRQYPVDDSKRTIKGHAGTALVLLNQTRAVIDTGGGHGGEKENTAGGKALKFHCSLRLRTSRIKSEFVEVKDALTGRKVKRPYGNLTDVKCVKSGIDGKQNHSTSMFIRYGYGIDDFLSIIEAGVVNRFIKKEGAYFAFGSHRTQGKEKFRKYLMENPKVFDELRQKITEAISRSAEPLKPEELDELDEAADLTSVEINDMDDEELEAQAAVEATEETVSEEDAVTEAPEADEAEPKN